MANEAQQRRERIEEIRRIIPRFQRHGTITELGLANNLQWLLSELEAAERDRERLRAQLDDFMNAASFRPSDDPLKRLADQYFVDKAMAWDAARRERS